MSADNPYRAPDSGVEAPAAPPGPVRLWRIPLWGALMFVAITLIHAIGEAIVRTSEIDRGSLQLAFALMIMIANVIASVGAFILYLFFLRGTARYPLLQILGVFVFLQLMTLFLAIFLSGSVEGLISVWTLAWNLVVCLAAYVAWYLFLRKLHRTT